MQSSGFQPLQTHERIQLIDALRGFALVGILIVNIPSFSRSEWGPAEQQIQNGFSDILLVLIDTKFITIFSLLFGAGFFVQQQRAEKYGIDFTAFYIRRMGILFVLGCVHAYLFWFGDIVRHYALLGIALLAVSHLSAKATLRLALIFVVFLTPLLFLLNGILPVHTTPDTIDGMPLSAFVYKSFTEGSYPQILRANWIIDPLHNFIQDMPLTLVSMFGKMVLGVWLAKIGFFRNPAEHETLLRKWMIWGSTAGVIGSIGFWAIKKEMLPIPEMGLVVLVFPISACLVLHSLFYLAVFTKLYHRMLGAVLLRYLVPVGRMGLSNYFGQTILAFGLFYVTGWVGYADPVGLTGLALLIFVIQILVSHWWLRYHEFGPVEWIWRTLSYMWIDRKTKTRVSDSISVSPNLIGEKLTENKPLNE
ncbi:DUF418 domain-containing protein [Xanthocytophaga flava]|uniref:DUF418 domain-containing protein n=1 Tax=Xanthocytophaga flava TaxID=3048013 RepID=UPI0028D283B9|nr:DUF418 domain-containing protein [Xanthocytophaga flavus]MDJ1467483.1 DUF418 domain-containing protein [Xanthocytophaga flavus]